MERSETRSDGRWSPMRKVVAAGILVALVAGVLALPYILPEASTSQDEPPIAGGDVVKQGTFSGSDSFHQVSGTVMIIRDGDTYVLRFEDYDATDGPDVYAYLTESANPRTTQDVEAHGLRVLIDGGTNGHATVRGTFNQPLPADFDPGRWNGVAIWCLRFAVLFGSAPLA